MNVETVGEDTKARVLIVDDDESVRQSVKRVLEASHINVTTVGNAVDALGLIHVNQFDAIVTDIVMPTMGGLEFLHLIRERDQELPVIILTGYPTLDSAVLAIKEGSFRYMMKPYAADELCATVSEAAAMYRLTVLKRLAFENRQSAAWTTGALSQLTVKFDEAISGLWMAFQPIIDWPNREVFGYEALVRTNSKEMGNPGLLFDAAERLGRVHDLGRRIRSQVASAICRAPPDTAIFVNLHSADLNDDELFSADSALSQYAQRVVLEVTERASLEQVQDVQGAMARLRKLNYRIAVDDLGAGYAGLSSFSQLEPDVVKLDMSLIREIDASKRKTSIVRSMIAVCARDLGTKVVCEGVETEAERNTLQSIGATLLQGYLFGRPEREFGRPELATAGISMR
jgi:EAL domain-containing protein (putative c-di-GMP-specific phosphodiesterase class I)